MSQNDSSGSLIKLWPVLLDHFMPPQNQSILTYLLLAKAEESRGNASAAKELYIKATQGNSSLKAIQLASPLFFDSNLEPLLKELE